MKLSVCSVDGTGTKYGVFTENTKYWSGTAIVRATIIVTWKQQATVADGVSPRVGHSHSVQLLGSWVLPLTAPPCFTTSEMKMLNTMHRPR